MIVLYYITSAVVPFVIGLNTRKLASKYLQFLPNALMTLLFLFEYSATLPTQTILILILTSVLCNFTGKALQMIGLTGGIACGKSTVVQILSDLSPDFAIIDCDLISREVVQPGSRAHSQIRAVFGDRIIQPDGQLDRSALGDIIFADKSMRSRLNRIIQPAILWTILKQLLHYKLSWKTVVLDAPLLYETGFL